MPIIKLFISLLLLPVFVSALERSSSDLQKELDAFKAKSDIPAFGAAVLKNSKLEIAASGVRRVDDPTLVTSADLWHLGSMTKSMTAVLIAVLVEEKRMQWTSTMKDIFPNLDIHPDFQNLPITRFLTHTTGLVDAVVLKDLKLVKEILNPDLSLPQARAILVKGVLSKPTSAKPQATKRYSNIGYMLVGAVVEKLSGKSWEDFLRQYLFRPLEMTSCGFGPTTLNPNSPADQPWGHVRNAQKKIVDVTPGPDADNPPVVGPAGTVHCSLTDIAKYVQFHLDQEAGRKTPLGLTMYQNLYKDVHDVGYSAGALVVDSNESWAKGVYYWHNGSNGFNYSYMVFAPKVNKAIVVTMNFGNGEEAVKLTNELIKILREK